MKRMFSVLLSLAMLLTMLPMTAMASSGTTHTLEDGGDLRALLADASVQNGDTIELLGTGHVNDSNSDSAPWIIEKAVTITGGDISLRAGGILLEADVTFDDVELGFANRVRNAIMANGHTLTLRNVTAASGTLEFHLFCGGLTGHSETADAGTHGQVLVQGSSDVGSIYAGSLSANGAENSFALPATVTVAGGSVGEIYACGALETPVDDEKWFDTEYVPDPPTADREKYTVTGNVTINLGITPSAIVSGATGDSANAAVNISGSGTAAHTLTDIGSLVLAEGASLVPSENSDLTDANVTVPETAKLDLSSMGDEITVGDFAGGGTLVLASGQMLTISGAVSGATSVVVPAADTGITAEKSGESSFTLAEGSGVDSFERDEYGSWTAGLFAYPVKTFTLSGASVQAGDTTAQLSAAVTFDDENASWEFDIPPINFVITVNGNAAPYDEEVCAYVDEVTGFAIYPSADGEYFVVEFPEGGASAGEYEISVTVPAVSTVDGEEITATVTLTVSGGEPAPVEPDITEPTPCFQTYDGTAQELIEEGTTSLGTMLYSTDGETWNAAIPTATNAGDYEVYWKVDGGEDFEDIVCEEPVEVSIYKKDLTITPKSYLLKVGDTVPDLTAEGAYTIEGFVLADTAETVIKGNIVLSFDKTPDMTKPDHYSIYVNGRETDDELTADNYDISTPFGALEVVECVHSFIDFTLATVNTENDSIFARCAEGCAEYAESAWVLTIEAPENAMYEEGLYHNAVLSYESQLGPEFDSENIRYSAEPVDAGTYTAYYICHDVEAYVTYEIAKRPLTIKADSKSIYAGDSAPTYTYTVTGWEENHDEGCLHQLTGITTVCSGDVTKAGTYEITFSGTPKVLDSDGVDDSENYTFTMQDGTLTVRNRSTGGGGGGGGDSTTVPPKPEEPKEEPKEEEKPTPGETFTDVPTDAYYTAAVDWAVEKGITNGTGGGSFEPEASCTRGQMVLFLYRMAGEPATNGVVNFTDISAGDYYARAVAWAVENGITTGMGNGLFAPEEECSRAQMAVFLFRMVGAAAGNEHIFGDVDVNAYYADAVAWAAANGITTGTGDGLFSPNSNCTRGQMVTFLFRCFAE